MKLNQTQNLLKSLTPPSQEISRDRTYAIYHEAYVQELTEALQATYPTVSWVLGEELFHKACLEFIETEPTVSFNLNHYGERLSHFFRLHRLGKKVPFLADLARFEWTHRSLYHKPSPPEPLSSERIQEILEADDCRVRFIDALEIFASPFHVSEIWMHRFDDPSALEDIMWEYPEWVLMFKRGHDIQVQRINHTEANILEDLKQGNSLTHTLFKYASAMSSERIGELFELMIKAGIIEDVLMEN